MPRMCVLRDRSILFALVLVSTSHLACCLKGFQSSGFFRGDLVMLSENDVRRNYEQKLIVVLGVLPAKRHCGFLQTVADRFSSNVDTVARIINRYSIAISGRSFSARRKCLRGRSSAPGAQILNGTAFSMNRTFDRSFIVERLVRLYNKLPLPFQCQILEEVGWKSVVNSKNKFLSKNEAWSGERTSEVSRLVQQTEQVLGQRFALIRVGSQCARIVLGEDSYAATVKFSCVGHNADSKTWLKLFKKQMARVYGKFAMDNGIQIPKEVLLFVGSRNLPYDAYHIEILNTTFNGNFRKVLFHIHLKKANSKALPANFILSSLHRYSSVDLTHLFQATNISFTAVMDKVGRRPSRRYNNMRKLFPAYLSKYFSMLDPHEKCFILSMLSAYTNNTLSTIVQFLNRKRFPVQISCFPKRNEVSAKSNRENIVISPKATARPSRRPHIYTNTPKPFVIGRESTSKEIINSRSIAAATPVEISMFVVLGAVAIVGTIFVLICITYIKRKRELKNEKRRQGVGATSEGNDKDSVDSAELDWIKRTQRIESEFRVFADCGNSSHASVSSVPSAICTKCTSQSPHSVPTECVFTHLCREYVKSVNPSHNQLYGGSTDHPLPHEFSNMPRSVESPERSEFSCSTSDSEQSHNAPDHYPRNRCKTKGGTICVLRQARYGSAHCTHPNYPAEHEHVTIADKGMVEYYRPRLHINTQGDESTSVAQGSIHCRSDLYCQDSVTSSNTSISVFSSGYKGRYGLSTQRPRCDESVKGSWYSGNNLAAPFSDSVIGSTCSDCDDLNCSYTNQRNSDEHIFSSQPPPPYVTCVGIQRCPSADSNRQKLNVIRGARRYRAALKPRTDHASASSGALVNDRQGRYPFNYFHDSGGTPV